MSEDGRGARLRAAGASRRPMTDVRARLRNIGLRMVLAQIDGVAAYGQALYGLPPDSAGALPFPSLRARCAADRCVREVEDYLSAACLP